MKKEQVFYRYYRSKWYLSSKNKLVWENTVDRYNHPITVCGVFDTDTGVMRFGISVCHETDQHNKKIAREVAYTKAMESPVETITMSFNHLSPGKIFNSLSEEVAIRHKRYITK